MATRQASQAVGMRFRLPAEAASEASADTGQDDMGGVLYVREVEATRYGYIKSGLTGGEMSHDGGR